MTNENAINSAYELGFQVGLMAGVGLGAFVFFLGAVVAIKALQSKRQ